MVRIFLVITVSLGAKYHPLSVVEAVQ